MLKNLLTVSGWTTLSRLLGLLRDQLLATFLGAGPVQDAYLVAFRLPNMFRRLFGEGAFNAAFVPQFSTLLEQQGPDRARHFANEAMGALILWLTLLMVLAEIFMPGLLWLVTPGFRGGGNTRYALAVTLTRIMFPYMVLICATALVSGVLNGLHRFGAAAAAYVSFNIVGIAAILLGAFVFHDVVTTSAWGITLSGFVQLGLVLLAAKREGMTLIPARPHLSPDLKHLIRKMGPGLVGSGVTQLNLTVDTLISTLLPTGAVSWLYFADRVNQLPLGVLGAAAGTTLLPVLTRHVAARDHAQARASLNRAIEYAWFLTIPATFGLLALAPSIMAALFGYGKFTALDVQYSSESLRAYALGLPAFVLIKVFSPGFFAHGDTATPVRIGFFTLALNFVLNLLLYKPLAQIGPPLASAIAALVNLMLLGILLKRREILVPSAELRLRLLKVTAAAALMALWVLALQHLLAPTLPQWHGLPRAGMLALLMLTGALIYLGALQAMGIADLRAIAARIGKRFQRR